MREMKNSGVEWISEIPVDWDILPAKRFFRNVKRVAGKDADNFERLALTLNGVIKRSKTDNEGLQPEQFESYQILKENEMVFKLIDLENVKTSRVGLSSYTGLVSPAYIVLTNDNTDNRFYYYWFISMYYNEVFNRLGGAGVRSALNAKDLLNIPAPNLNESERKSIADFLDEKCAKIDAVIEKQKQVIEKLKEYKLSVITEAVTKGLDPTVPMKDSGVEWIGKIPEGWKVTKLSRVCKTSSGSTPARNKDNEYFLDDAKIRWVRTLDLNDGLVYDSSEKISNVALLNSSCSIMPKDTVCVAMYGGSGTIGKCGILQKECATNQAICSIVCDNKIINPYYMFYQMISSRKYWMKFAVGTRKDPNISQEIVANAIVVAPSLNIQSEIIGYLNNKCSVIDSAIVKKQSIVEKLTEYKKSLIYEVVTGKREV